MTYQSKQAEELVRDYGWWIVGILAGIILWLIMGL